MKTALFLGFGVLFWVSGAATCIQTLSLYIPLLFFVDQRTSAGRIVQAYQKQGDSKKEMSNLAVCHVTAWQGVRCSCRTAAELPLPELPPSSPRQSCWTVAGALRWQSFSSGGGALAALLLADCAPGVQSLSSF